LIHAVDDVETIRFSKYLKHFEAKERDEEEAQKRDGHRNFCNRIQNGDR